MGLGCIHLKDYVLCNIMFTRFSQVVNVIIDVFITSSHSYQWHAIKSTQQWFPYFVDNINSIIEKKMGCDTPEAQNEEGKGEVRMLEIQAEDRKGEV